MGGPGSPWSSSGSATNKLLKTDMVAMKLYKDVQVSHPIMVVGTAIGVWLDGTRGIYPLSSCGVESMSLHGRHPLSFSKKNGCGHCLKEYWLRYSHLALLLSGKK